MKNKLTHYIIHCSATPEGRIVTGKDIRMWHLGPAVNTKTGLIRYMGKNYTSVEDLPKEEISGVPISRLVGGRGWRQVGYADIIHLDGEVENLVPYNEDEWVDPWEITNGILSSDSIFLNARHVVYAGGMDKSMKFARDTRTFEQNEALTQKVQKTINAHPDILVGGHNQVNNKACPSFNVPKWLRSIGIEEKNIMPDLIKYTGHLE